MGLREALTSFSEAFDEQDFKTANGILMKQSFGSATQYNLCASSSPSQGDSDLQFVRANNQSRILAKSVAQTC